MSPATTRQAFVLALAAIAGTLLAALDATLSTTVIVLAGGSALLVAVEALKDAITGNLPPSALLPVLAALASSTALLIGGFYILYWFVKGCFP